jgi:hypothetical protein
MAAGKLNIGYRELAFTTRISALPATWVSSSTKSSTSLHASYSDVIQIIRMALVSFKSAGGYV